MFRGLSFETISGFGSNGSIVHYRVSKNTNKTFKKNNLYLFDSGAQYLDGTTDITRTISIGDDPTDEQRNMFTRVLKGNIGLNNYNFTERTMGKVLDKIARKYLKINTIIHMVPVMALEIIYLFTKDRSLYQRNQQQSLRKE